ncbi:MAG: hypothetical protein QM621_00425 [Aeromicrobium sp.]|uniref:hypothetical protein n=1 Tax=Aeromicrobium sp. TaxID=1871063 RepID=UPI0039E37EA6
MARQSLYMTLLRRHMDEGKDWHESSERALVGVQQAYDLIKQAVLGPPQLQQQSAKEPPSSPGEGSHRSVS